MALLCQVRALGVEAKDQDDIDGEIFLAGNGDQATLPIMSDLEAAATTAFSEYITSCSVIVTSSDPEFDHGSGVAVRYNGKHYLLTAAHVLRPLKNLHELRIIGRPPTPFKNVALRQLQGDIPGVNDGSFGFSESTRVDAVSRIFGEAEEDIVAIEINRGQESLPYTIFHDLVQCNSDDLNPGSIASAFGFPGAIAQRVMHQVTQRQGVMANSLHIDIEVKDISVAPEGLNSAVNFITDYTFEDAGCDPKGMSGCGIWSRPQRSTGLVWSPYTTRLLGIQSSFYPRSKLLVAVRIERVLTLLSQAQKPR